MNEKRKTCSLDDFIGIIDIPPIEGRFQEILCTQKILDTETDIEYDGLVDREFLELVNEIVEEKEKYFELGKDEFESSQRRHLHRLSVFQEYAQKYERQSKEHDLICEIGSKIGLPTGIFGDINNGADK
jgi:hypothetical protein